jgi:hypothetical protein
MGPASIVELSVEIDRDGAAIDDSYRVDAVFSKAFDDKLVDSPLLPLFFDEVTPFSAAWYGLVVSAGESATSGRVLLRDLVVLMKERHDVGGIRPGPPGRKMMVIGREQPVLNPGKFLPCRPNPWISTQIVELDQDFCGSVARH